MGPNLFAGRRRLWAILGAGAAGVVIGLARRRGDRAGPLPVTGRMARGAGVARLAGRVGRSYVSTSARQVFASAARKEQLQADQQLKTAAEVVAALGNMKGVLMKIGQMASYLDTGLPEPVREALAGLQRDAPPMAPELAALVVTEEFGRPPEEVFAEWDPIPIAAASIGQVHRAITHDGVAVAVKVQYPGVDDAIRSDLDNTRLLLQMTSMAFPGLDAGPIVAELRARVLEELDYRQEASNQQRFADLYATHPFIHIPAVRADLSTGRVLTTELVTGARYSEVLQWPAEQRDLAGEAIFRFVFGCLYRIRAFNGDPHPGNYIFHGDGQVTILDFGLVKWFTDADVDLLAEMVKTLVVHRDIRAFRVAVEKAGFLKPDRALSDDQVAAYFDHYYELVLGGGRKAFSTEYASQTLRTFFDASNEVVKRANVPAPFVILQRINLGLYAVLAGLGATADWRRIAEEIWPFVNAPPSTALGEREAAWRKRPVGLRGTNGSIRD
jgi:predicted unusual protein kinase regulating ubiquinone biosynthesis (AarF/ABC1/UbiB family)